MASLRICAIAALTALGLGLVEARAETPADTLVIADKIDDIVSLDPAESFEFSGNDALNNIYDTLIELDPENDFALVPGLAESWSVSDDGKTYTFQLRDDVKFHSGNPVTAEDAAWSLQRAVKLDKTPSFILTQFGFTPENVEEMIKATGPHELQITTDKAYAPSFFYNILTSVVSSVVDKQEALANEQDGDLGYEWLKTHSAGSGPFQLRGWKPNDSILLEAAGDYWRAPVELKRVLVRHVEEPATQRLLLERGDVDIARKLTPTDIEGVSSNPDIAVDDELRGRIFYLALNQKVEPLDDPKVIEAVKHLVPYQDMADSFLKGQFVVHQNFLPQGFLGAVDDKPFSMDVERAKQLLAEAGHPDGFEVKLTVRDEAQRVEMGQAIQNALAQAGIKANIQVVTGKQALEEYRARKHELTLESWGPDYPDPHTNADTFAHNPDNSDEAKLTGKLAWRTGYPAEKTTPMVEAAVVEKDEAKRRALYEEMQRVFREEAPFVPMFQEIQQVARRGNVEGFSSGGTVASAYYWPVTKSAQ